MATTTSAWCILAAVDQTRSRHTTAPGIFSSSIFGVKNESMKAANSRGLCGPAP